LSEIPDLVATETLQRGVFRVSAAFLVCHDALESQP
jgi:hypothetical protein